MRNAYFFALVFAGAGCLSTEVGAQEGAKEYWTTDEVFQRQEALVGQRIAIRGWAWLTYAQTGVGCIPPSCDCNMVWGYLVIRADQQSSPSSVEDHRISISGVSCYGNECGTRCKPFDPLAGPAFEFVGELYESSGAFTGASLGLADIDLDASRKLTGGTDLHSMTASPLNFGSFVCGCQPVDGYCHVGGAAPLSCEPAP